MTDNDIIKALECCCTQDGTIPCYDCPCWDYDMEKCEGIDHASLHALITRQKARIERLEKQLYGERVYLKQLLPKNFDFEHCTVLEAVINARTEAIKEFCKKRGIEYVENDI